MSLHEELIKKGDLDATLNEFSALAKELSDLWVINIDSQTPADYGKEWLADALADTEELGDDDLL